ncbi:MAG: response regulator [Candidatus Tectomicrobia bacterium]|uniref:Response regulator n=1 Tax=Tectimicrobiota bacterium TaxID=2528274 RepID=A0A932CQ26_UNCTE|nr:response regulator [Candidatus Tectomicrobia bacterium]
MAVILVIDDEEAVRESLYEVLSLTGQKVTMASNGREGLDRFQEGNYRLVFTDLAMPEMDGWAVAQAIKEVNPQTRVILVTGWWNQLDEDKLKEHWIDRVVPKPFTIDQIFQAVSEALEGN